MRARRGGVAAQQRGDEQRVPADRLHPGHVREARAVRPERPARDGLRRREVPARDLDVRAQDPHELQGEAGVQQILGMLDRQVTLQLFGEDTGFHHLAAQQQHPRAHPFAPAGPLVVAERDEDTLAFGEVVVRVVEMPHEHRGPAEVLQAPAFAAGVLQIAVARERLTEPQLRRRPAALEHVEQPVRPEPFRFFALVTDLLRNLQGLWVCTNPACTVARPRRRRAYEANHRGDAGLSLPQPGRPYRGRR